MAGCHPRRWVGVTTMDEFKPGDKVQVATNVQFQGLGGQTVTVIYRGEYRGLWEVKDGRGGQWELDGSVLTKVAK